MLNSVQQISKENLIEICIKYFKTMKGLNSLDEFRLSESVETSRYSVEVNFRTSSKEVLEGYAKIVLGYISAALKNHGFHTKHVFTEKPLRLLVASRNWDNGEFIGTCTWNPDQNCFVISKGFYNKERKTVSVTQSRKCTNDDAAEISKDLRNMMHQLKKEPDKKSEPLKAVPLKRGPK